MENLPKLPYGLEPKYVYWNGETNERMVIVSWNETTFYEFIMIGEYFEQVKLYRKWLPPIKKL